MPNTETSTSPGDNALGQLSNAVVVGGRVGHVVEPSERCKLARSALVLENYDEAIDLVASMVPEGDVGVRGGTPLVVEALLLRASALLAKGEQALGVTDVKRAFGVIGAEALSVVALLEQDSSMESLFMAKTVGQLFSTLDRFAECPKNIVEACSGILSPLGDLEDVARRVQQYRTASRCGFSQAALKSLTHFVGATLLRLVPTEQNVRVRRAVAFLGAEATEGGIDGSGRVSSRLSSAGSEPPKGENETPEEEQGEYQIPIPTKVLQARSLVSTAVKSSQVNWNIRALRETLEKELGVKIPPFNRLGGEAGFIIQIGLCDQYRTRIEERVQRHHGIGALAAKDFGVNLARLRQIYKKLTEHGGKARELAEIAAPPGTLIPDLLDAAVQGRIARRSNGDNPAMESELTQHLIEAIGTSPRANIKSEVVQRAVVGWVCSSDSGLRLAKILKEVGEVLPFVTRGLFSTASVVWSLGIADEVEGAIGRLTEESGGVLTHVGMQCGWGNKGAISEVKQLLERLATLREAWSVETRRSSNAKTQQELPVHEKAPILGAKPTGDVPDLLQQIRISDVLDANARRKEVLRELEAPEVRWNLQVFLYERHPELSWGVSRGYDFAVRGLGIEREAFEQLDRVFKMFNGGRKAVAAYFGMNLASFNHFMDGLSYDPDTAEMVPGNMLPLFDTTTEAILEKLENPGSGKKPWSELHLLKSAMVAKACERFGDGTLQEKTLTHGDVIRGTGIGAQFRSLVDARRAECGESLGKIGASFGWSHSVKRTVLSILDQIRPICFASWPNELLELDRSAFFNNDFKEGAGDRLTAIAALVDRYEALRESPLLPRAAEPILPEVVLPIAESTSTSELRVATLLHRPWYYDWEDRTDLLGQELQAGVTELQKIYPQIEWFWVQVAPTLNRTGGTTPTLYLAAVETGLQNVVEIRKGLLDLKRGDCAWTTYKGDADGAAIALILEQISAHGFRQVEAISPLPSVLDDRVRTLQEAAQVATVVGSGVIGDAQKASAARWWAEHFEKSLHLGRRLAGEFVPSGSIETHELKTPHRGPAHVELFFFLQGTEFQRVCALARNVMAASEEGKLPAMANLLEVVSRSDHLCDLLGVLVQLTEGAHLIVDQLRAGVDEPSVLAMAQSIVALEERFVAGRGIEPDSFKDEEVIEVGRSGPVEEESAKVDDEVVSSSQVAPSSTATPTAAPALCPQSEFEQVHQELAHHLGMVRELVISQQIEAAVQLGVESLQLSSQIFEGEEFRRPANVSDEELLSAISTVIATVALLQGHDEWNAIYQRDVTFSELVLNFATFATQEKMDVRFDASCKREFNELVGDAFSGLDELQMALDHWQEALSDSGIDSEITERELQLLRKILAYDPQHEYAQKRCELHRLVSALTNEKSGAVMGDERMHLIGELGSIAPQHPLVVTWRENRELEQRIHSLMADAGVRPVTNGAELRGRLEELLEDLACTSTMEQRDSYISVLMPLAGELASAEIEQQIEDLEGKVRGRTLAPEMLLAAVMPLNERIVDACLKEEITFDRAQRLLAELDGTVLLVQHYLTIEAEREYALRSVESIVSHAKFEKNLVAALTALIRELKRPISIEPSPQRYSHMLRLVEDVLQHHSAFPSDGASSAFLGADFIRGGVGVAQSLSARLKVLCDLELTRTERATWSASLKEVRVRFGAYLLTCAQGVVEESQVASEQEYSGRLERIQRLATLAANVPDPDSALVVDILSVGLPQDGDVATPAILALEELILGQEPTNSSVLSRRKQRAVLDLLEKQLPSIRLQLEEFSKVVGQFCEGRPADRRGIVLQRAVAISEHLRLMSQTEKIDGVAELEKLRAQLHELDQEISFVSNQLEQIFAGTLQAELEEMAKEVRRAIDRRGLRALAEELLEDVKEVHISRVEFLRRSGILHDEMRAAEVSDVEEGVIQDLVRRAEQAFSEHGTVQPEVLLARQMAPSVPPSLQGNRQKDLWRAVRGVIDELGRVREPSLIGSLPSNLLEAIKTLLSLYDSMASSGEHRTFLQLPTILATYRAAQRVRRKVQRPG